MGSFEVYRRTRDRTHAVSRRIRRYIQPLWYGDSVSRFPTLILFEISIEASTVLEYQYCIEAQIITGECMTTIQNLWQSINSQYTNGQSLGKITPQNLSKIDDLVFSDDIENIRNGLTLMTTIAAEYLCRYLKLDGESVVLRDAGRFSAPLSVERVLVESVKDESMWQDLYESGA